MGAVDEHTPAAWQAPLIDLLCAVLRHRTVLGLAVLIGLGIGFYLAFSRPPFYRSSAVAVLMPREQPLFDVSLIAPTVETAEEGSQRSDNGPLTLPANDELYSSLLSSRAVLEGIAHDLRAPLEAAGHIEPDHSTDRIVRTLRLLMQIDGSDDGLITVTATANHASLAAELANAVIEAGREASRIIERDMLAAQATQLEASAEAVRLELAAFVAELEAFCSEHEVFDPQTQVLERLRQIRELAYARDQTLAELRRRELHHTDADAKVRQLRAEAEYQEKRIEAMRASISGGVSEAEYGPLLVQYDMLRREVETRRDMASTLSAQARVYRIRADAPAGSIAVVRAAQPAAYKAGPARGQLVVLAMATATLLGIATALLLEQWRLARRDPTLTERFDRLQGLLHLKRKDAA